MSTEEQSKIEEGQSRLTVGLERTVFMPITGCDLCPALIVKRHYTADSFENVMEWTCNTADGKRITLREWNDPKIEIPSWCPLRSNVELTGSAHNEKEPKP